MHQTKKLISGGKRWKWVIPLAKAIGRIISWAFGDKDFVLNAGFIFFRIIMLLLK